MTADPIPVPSKLEARTVAVLVYVVVVTVFTVVADQAVFVRPPESVLERVLAIPGALTYDVAESRLVAAAVAAAVIATVLGIVGAAAWLILHRTVLEPLHMRRVVQTTLREEKLFNHYRDKENL